MSTPKAGRLVRVGLYDLTPGYLGKGNFAMVRLGVHKLTKTSVAVKIVEKADLDEENLQKISREIEIMRRLNHPSIIRLYQVMETDGMIYIVTEFAAKGDIFDHLVNNGKMSEPEACHVFAQIISAVKYCHTRGVVHRDLKVENLLLDGDSNIKLADFGFSNYYTEKSLLSTWCGSPPYAAPELFEGKKYVGPKVDMWSLGVVLYVLVSGTLPFDGPTLMDLRERVVRCQYRIPFFLSQECEQLLKGLLVIEPEKRLGIDTIISHPWTIKSALPMTAPLLEQILHLQNPDKELPVNEFVVDAIVKEVNSVASEVNVDRNTVIDSVRLNKCDDLCAIYHMVEQNNRNHERDRLQAAMPAIVPPSSPTSKSPFFNHPTLSNSMENPSQVKAKRPEVTEVYSSVGAEYPNNVDGGDDRSLNTRRHTVGPQSSNRFYTPPRPYLIPVGGRAAGGILPQTNLMQNLPLVSNLPPENFSSKNPHLLKPPPALLGGLNNTGRRASDGGGAYFNLSRADEAAAVLMAGSQVLHYSGGEDSKKPPKQPQQPQKVPDSCSSSSQAAAVQPQPAAAASVVSDSPRRRRTGLHTVIEKPPEISPELVQEVENRMRAQASPNKQGSLRMRRTGLSTVMEVNKSACEPSSPGPDRLSPKQVNSTMDAASSQACEAFRVMQEEAAAARLAQNEGASSADSASSGYMSPHFLRPPSPSDDLHLQPRRSSDSGVDMPGSDHGSGLRNSTSAPSQPIQQLYDEMYMDPSSPTVVASNSRRYSYPNSPVHGQISASVSTNSSLNHYNATNDLHRQSQPSPQLDQRLQQLKLQTEDLYLQQQQQQQQQQLQRSPMAFKGSITQGVPAAAAAVSQSPMILLEAPRSIMPHSHSYDEAYDSTVRLGAGMSGISGSATNLWQLSGATEETEIDYDLFTASCTPRPSPRPSVTFSDTYNNPEICVTNVTGDEIKFVFGASGTPGLLTTAPPVQSPTVSSEPMDHS